MPFVVGRGLTGGGSKVVLTLLRGSIRGTVTQSGSSVGVYGFEGRLGFGTNPLCGGLTADLAGLLLSSHHFLWSELAGGRPGSIGS